MNKTRTVVLILAACMFVPSTAYPIPAFARKNGFNCNMCHTAYTKLNDFGERYRANGYQMPGQEGLEKNVFEIAPPIAFRTSFGMMVAHSQQANTNGFDIQGFDLLAAGVLHKNLSFLIIYTPRLDEPAADYTGPQGNTNPSQPAALESANLVFSNLVQDALNLRIGRFEPAYHPFSSKRSFYLQQPYEIYTFTTPSNDFVFDDNQMGAEASGYFASGFRYAGGVVNGTGANPDNNRAKDVYLRLARVIGRGEGQSAGQRIGLFAYLGWQPTSLGDDHLDVTGEADGRRNKPFRRIGGDVSLNWQTLNFHGMFMQGSDDKEFVSGATKNYEFTGGFARLDYAALMNNRLVGSVLFNWVTPPKSDDRKIAAYSALLRYYLGDWTAVNVALHAEFTHRVVGRTTKLKTDKFALMIDFAF